MDIKHIHLQNFRNFEGKHSFFFLNLNLVKGENGKGKTSLALSSILFAIYGYSAQALERVPTRNKSKSCSVEVIVEHLGDTYKIKRAYPTAITISKNKEIVKLANNQQKQRYLNDLFKNVDYFKKFRLIDNDSGINILEEGKTSLQKTLLSFHQDMFNAIRKNLMEKKRERETFNKDIVTSSHYPSEKRLEQIQIGLTELMKKYKVVEEEYQDANQKYKFILQKKNQQEAFLSVFEKQEKSILNLDHICPTCNQEIDQTIQFKLLEELQGNITKTLDFISSFQKDTDKRESTVTNVLHAKDDITNKHRKLSVLKGALETRLKQKQFKYTSKDVAIIKNAIEELDKFYKFYITEGLKLLEPIINSVLDKIGFRITFLENFDIELTRDEITYSYKDLSKGERLILSLAFKVALLLEKNETGVIIADEGFSSLDEGNLDYILNLFRDIPFQLIAVIHRFDNQLEGINIIDLNNPLKLNVTYKEVA